MAELQHQHHVEGNLRVADVKTKVRGLDPNQGHEDEEPPHQPHQGLRQAGIFSKKTWLTIKLQSPGFVDRCKRCREMPNDES